MGKSLRALPDFFKPIQYNGTAEKYYTSPLEQAGAFA